MIPLDFFSDLISNPALQKALWPALVETMQMLVISGLATVVIGLPLGVVLFVVRPGGMAEHRVTDVIVSSIIVNNIRSFPYAILMVSLIPITRFLVGTAVGPIAASVSLSIASIPFFARLVETALKDVHAGKIDAAHAMGSTRLQTITKVLIPEAMPTLIAGVTTTLVTIVGYSAMAGLIGGGGLGRLAYNYGFQRYQLDVMLVTVILLIIIVQLIQVIGDRLSLVVDHR